MDASGTHRRFLLALGGVRLSAGVGDIAAAAEHAAAQGALEFFHADEAADVEAITAQILPGGAKPGAREARAAHFIDHALGTFFASRATAFRRGLADFQNKFRTAHPSMTSFAAAPPSEQIVYLTSVEHTEFFEALRVLTIVGTLSAPVYGGNYGGAGWKMTGFEEQHVFSPPFGATRVACPASVGNTLWQFDTPPSIPGRPARPGGPLYNQWDTSLLSSSATNSALPSMSEPSSTDGCSPSASAATCCTCTYSWAAMRSRGVMPQHFLHACGTCPGLRH